MARALPALLLAPLLTLLVGVLHSRAVDGQPTHLGDGPALLALKAALYGDQQPELTSWRAGSDPCSGWMGVACSCADGQTGCEIGLQAAPGAQRRVVALNLAGVMAAWGGTLPAEPLGDLDELRLLNLSGVGLW